MLSPKVGSSSSLLIVSLQLLSTSLAFPSKTPKICCLRSLSRSEWSLCEASQKHCCPTKADWAIPNSTWLITDYSLSPHGGAVAKAKTPKFCTRNSEPVLLYSDPCFWEKNKQTTSIFHAVFHCNYLFHDSKKHQYHSKMTLLFPSCTFLSLCIHICSHSPREHQDYFQDFKSPLSNSSKSHFCRLQRQSILHWTSYLYSRESP